MDFSNLRRPSLFKDFFILKKLYLKKVLISVDRFLLLKVKDWEKVYFKPKIAALTGFLVSFIIFLINFNVIFTYGYEFKSNGVAIIQCYATTIIPATQFMAVWNQASFIFGTFTFNLKSQKGLGSLYTKKVFEHTSQKKFIQ